jgi:hypothetical protein
VGVFTVRELVLAAAICLTCSHAVAQDRQGETVAPPSGQAEHPNPVPYNRDDDAADKMSWGDVVELYLRPVKRWLYQHAPTH